MAPEFPGVPTIGFRTMRGISNSDLESRGISRRVVLVLPNLGFGGAQRVASIVAGELVKDGYWVTIALTALARGEMKQLHDVPKSIEVIRVGAKWIDKGTILDNAPVVGYLSWRVRQMLTMLSLRALLRRSNPDVVMSFLVSANVWTVLASLGSRYRVVVSERNDPDRQEISRFYWLLRRISYRFADVVTSNSSLPESTCRKHFGVSRAAVIPNVIGPVSPLSPSQAREKRLVFVGRLVPQKDVATLLRFMHLLIGTDPGWFLDIVGDGSERGTLERQSFILGLTNNVVFHGFQAEPSVIVEKGSLLIQPSLHEGTPNSVLEAMALGIPCVVSDSSPGPRHLVERVAPELVFRTGDESSLLHSIAFATSSSAQYELLSHRAWEVACEHQWENVRSTWLDCLGLIES